ncbi:metallophosphoesterase [Cobetia sp. ICG0124]|uniref:metallophosphoesterase family protein n=1 Tax=Cobetia sp. ICG0124 TaxID=2053669 RepID=UPI0026BF46E7
MRLIQISDCHLRADPDARSRLGFPLRQLEAVMAHASSLRPDILLVTGDVSQDESPASYRLAGELFDALGCPWFWLAGNHDHPDFMQELRPFHQELDLGDWRLLCLDSRISGQAGGELGREQLAALSLSLRAGRAVSPSMACPPRQTSSRRSAMISPSMRRRGQASGSWISTESASRPGWSVSSCIHF